MQLKVFCIALFFGMVFSNLTALFSQAICRETGEIKQPLIFCSQGRLYRIDNPSSESSTTDITPANCIVHEVSAIQSGMYVCTGEIEPSKEADPQEGPFFLYASFSAKGTNFVYSTDMFYDIALSPNGKKVLYTIMNGTTEGFCSVLFCRDLETAAVCQLSKDVSVAKAPSWSPDGKKVAFYYGGNSEVLFSGGFSVRSIFPDGAGEIEIAPPSMMTRYTPNRDLPPVWSKDGRSVFFEARYEGDPDGYHIYRVAVDGSSPPVRISSGRASSISPDGKRIYFSEGGVYVQNLDGKERLPIAAYEGRERGVRPKVSIDGRLIAFVTHSGIYIAKTNGSEVKKITDKMPTRSHQLYWISNSIKAN